MKAFGLFFVILALAVAVYLLLFSSKEKIVVTEKIIAATQNNFDINAPQVTEGFSSSFIEGTAENISDEKVTGILIKYKIQGKEVEARIENIPAKAKVNFKTNTIKTTGSNPLFNLVSVTYNE